jgi:hypothetical protein
MLKNFTAALVFMLFCVQLAAQGARDNTMPAFNVNLTAGFHSPGGDLADRFSNHYHLGGGVEYIFASNFIIGAETEFYFGNRVNEDPLENIRTPQGQLVANNRTLADNPLRQRGFYAGLTVGKLIRLSSTNPKSGIRVTVSGGILQHHIRIQDDPMAPVAAIREDYKKGYDRLTNGFALNEFVGYQYMARDRRINLYAGFVFGQGFTKSKRSYDFDTMQADTKQRLDLNFGFKLGWTLPFYIGETGDEILY